MRIRALLASAALSLTGLPALAGVEAEALIAGTSVDISDPVRGQQAFSDSIDIPSVARFSLGKHARRVSEEDLERFTEAFHGYVNRTFEKHSDDFTNAQVDVLRSVDRSATDSIVETRVTPTDGEVMTVRWRVVERGGEWRVVDVEVLGLWLAIEQRAQIAAIMDNPHATIDDAIAALGS
ncbi:MAG: phospholipid-binding protein MlaC [Hyphomonas sp.]